MAPISVEIPSIEEEFLDADLGDERLNRRLSIAAQQLEANPSASFPKAMGGDAELEALYRLFGNRRFGWRKVIEPHLRETTRRCKEAGDVIIVHDPTEFRFEGMAGARRGLGWLAKGAQRGFYGHFSLALSADGENRPLGILGFAPLIRPKPKKFESRRAANRHTESKSRSERESAYWDASVRRTQRRMTKVHAIHVMDRAADDYALWAPVVENGARFVIRSRFDRSLTTPDGQRTSLSTEVAKVEGKLLRDVALSPFRGKREYSGKKRPDRSRRMATLHVRATSVTAHCPKRAEGPARVTVNVVDVYEPNPPASQEPVHWRLLTSEPIDSLKALERIVDIYRARWVIEEFFKALKTGCSYEERQLMSLPALLKALMLLTPIAWRLLLMRTLARDQPQRPATDIATEDEIALLRAISKRVKLGPQPTCDEFLCAIAGLGGHLKRNGPPGWQTIWKGFDDFLAAQRGWNARARCDQS